MIKKILPLALLTIGLLQPMLAMEPTRKLGRRHRRNNRKKLTRHLRRAVKEDDTQAVATLLANGASPNSSLSFVEGKSPLIQARKNIEICRLLLEYGADANARYQDGTTALMRAVRFTAYDLCELLIEYGAEVNAQSENGETALMLTAQYLSGGSDKTRKLLLAHGADLSTKDQHGQTALRRAFPFTYEHSMLISNSQFYFYCTSKKLQAAQQQTRRRIWAMKVFCPQLPKDILEMILAVDQDTWQDACCTPLLLHAKKYKRITLMPLPVLRTLIKHKALDLGKTIEICTTHKMNQLTPIMLEALIEWRDRGTNLETMLDPSRLEEHFGQEIRDNIRAELSPSPENAGWITSCAVQ